ncbi:MBL fold metallo-hydrolase [Daejeonella sp.]|uniref:MBL fold metallo-hydrolase n=1 Tax=Daejeonella sp. TaxID=2805397 RepID=UPI0027178EBF|nr:MBL fold metallo-hydrolase [Daejeonella sp.]MDO8991529.1 MBL fold metallo-hydrolase [Daejeonella sp.]MDP2414981.1 MBL fold metallo-hydrolase [Daejeonella sp.]
MKQIKVYFFAIFLPLITLSAVFSQEQPARITILYDAFGKASPLKRGWGYSALVEYAGKRVLFDTGGDNDKFAYNVKALGLDLSRLDLVVLSHRHGDHTSGLNYVLSINPGVKIYTPSEGGAFGTPISPALLKLIQVRVEAVPEDLRYFDGNPPEKMSFGTPWPGAKFIQIREPTEVLPGFFLFSTTSDVSGTKEMNEISMAIRTPRGIVLISGCSHPGIEKIIETASKIDSRIYSILGGFHLVDVSDSGVTGLARSFRDKWKIERMAPSHCTGQLAFSEFIRVYGDKFDHAGLGSIISLPSGN